MLKRLATEYGVPPAAVVVLSVAGLAVFWAIFAFATHSGLVTLWPEMPRVLAVCVALVGPLVFLFGVGIVCATHDRWASNPKTAAWLKLLKWLGLAAVGAYVVFQAVRILG